jgi:hypothetical protein
MEWIFLYGYGMATSQEKRHCRYEGYEQCLSQIPVVLRSRACPGGTFDNSPTLQRWDSSAGKTESCRDG